MDWNAKSFCRCQSSEAGLSHPGDVVDTQQKMQKYVLAGTLVTHVLLTGFVIESQ